MREYILDAIDYRATRRLQTDRSVHDFSEARRLVLMEATPAEFKQYLTALDAAASEQQDDEPTETSSSETNL
jgi:hypothetical protein